MKPVNIGEKRRFQESIARNAANWSVTQENAPLHLIESDRSASFSRNKIVAGQLVADGRKRPAMVVAAPFELPAQAGWPSPKRSRHW